ncbi:DUF3817 domain-containing protein [Ornithinimicrobium sp. F0845]|uniref:DUF3817 domain-containing protein n=1 Tax=Ornithinimicrobium sp. F0845 TaxID=2926412 RepID=UPI001FF42E18|nr:DUF3817 domain-containing protein [Ornithinimicrobium sp. F0845]
MVGAPGGGAPGGEAPEGGTARAARQLAERKRARPTDDWRARNRDSALTYWARDAGVTRTIFRVAAITEAFTWLGLLVGMYFKHVAETTEVGVQVFGPLHGAMFIVYCVVVLTTRSVFGWSPKVTLLGLAAAVPPFATVVFERWALRTGLLDDPGSRPVRQ